jgi:hypothetical protein
VKRDPNVEAYRLLRGFVPKFRDFVRGQLVARYGPERWLDKVPEDVRQRLSEFEKKWTENPWVDPCAESPLDFSYEEDLVRIVTDDDNWKNVFRRWFGSDKRLIETKLKEIRWLRDHVAHFRTFSRDQEAKLRSLCRDVNLCIARAAKVQADSAAPEGLISPDDLLSGQEVADFLASQVRSASGGRGGGTSWVSRVEASEATRIFLLETEFELGAAPDETNVLPTRVHELYGAWKDSPPDEVLAWQTYAPREPVAEGSRVHLAIRYNPAALAAPKERRGVRRCKRSVACWIGAALNVQMARPGSEVLRRAKEISWDEFEGPIVRQDLGEVMLTPGAWAFLEYVPSSRGLYHVFWYDRRRNRMWAFDMFWVE